MKVTHGTEVWNVVRVRASATNRAEEVADSTLLDSSRALEKQREEAPLKMERAMRKFMGCSVCHRRVGDKSESGRMIASLKTCSRCLVAVYCSDACQRSDWKAHKAKCTPPPNGQS